MDSVWTLQTAIPCRLKEAEYGYICECDENYCDTLDVPLPSSGPSYVLITSSKSGDRFNYTDEQFFNRTSSIDNQLMIGRKTSYRKIIGFGGAFTGAVSIILNRLPTKLKECFYKSYYSSTFGIGYSMMRMPIGGSDFDLKPWVYSPEKDTTLSNFHELDPRDKSRNEQIKELKEKAGNIDIKIVAAAWYAPPWMRAKKKWSGYPDNQVMPKYYQTWADYHTKWLNLMKQDGMAIWGLSPGNEPSFSQYFEEPTMSWNGTDQGKWLVGNLMPALKSSGNENITILGVDDMRNATLLWLREMEKGNPHAIDAIDIVAVHAYFDWMTSPQILDDVYRLYNKSILYTEMNFAQDDPTVHLGSWTRAEKLIEVLMHALSHDISGYIDWNLMLNSTGGPGFDASSHLDACIIANEDFTEVIKQPMFYAMAHFSKYIPPGSKKIQTNIRGAQSKFIESVAYLRPDKRISVILYNNHIDTAIDLDVNDMNKGSTTVHLKPKSLNTLVYAIND